MMVRPELTMNTNKQYNKMLAFPAKALIRFWHNHHLLNPLGQRPRWRVVSGRSNTYVLAVEKELKRLGATIRTSCKVVSSSNRDASGMTIKYESGQEERFDRVVFCTHSDITLSILGDQATKEEHEALAAVAYEPNRIVLHSDETVMPRAKAAWASWNVMQRTKHNNDAGVCVTYWLNRLQNLPEGTRTMLCTLNPITDIDPSTIMMDFTLHHPVYNLPALEAQRFINETQNNAELGKTRVVWFGGAWLGNGFHEDGVRSGLLLADALCPPVPFKESPGWSLASTGIAPEAGGSLERFGLQVFEYVADKSIKQGHLKVVLPTGDEIGPFGRKTRAEAVALNEPVCELRVRDLSMFLRVVRDSDIGLGEAYMEKLFELPKGHEDLDGLFKILLDNRDRFAETMGMNTFLASPVALIASGLYKAGNVVQSIRHYWRRNTIEGSRQNIHEHYDLGNDFYKLFLDETMSYSSGIHASPSVSLKDAQLAKYDRIIAKAKLTPNSHVLEIGCGWGGFAARAVETTGCRVTGVTISTEQLAYGVQRMKDIKYDDRVNLVFCDYRNIPTTFTPASFDAVVSIEMLEAVGHENLPHYFEVVNAMLKPNAPAVIQVIGMPNERYDEYMHSSDFIRRHIFPGGHLPCMDALKAAIEKTNLSIGDVFDIGPDYAESLLAWRLRFYDQRAKLLEMGFSEMFIRKWLFYFAYCEIGFRKRYIYDWQIVFEKTRFETTSSTSISTKKDRELTSSYANFSPTSSWDFITGAFFGAWFVLCAVAVMEKGRHLLIIPAFMAAASIAHIVLGNLKPHVRYEFGALASAMIVSVVALAGLIVGGDLTQLAVLIGTGLCGADLSAMVWSGVYSPRMVRVLFAAAELSFLGIASFYGPQTEPQLHQLMLSHLLASSAFHMMLHANVIKEGNAVVRMMLPVTLAGCFAVHGSALATAWETSPLTTAFAAGGLMYDSVAILGVASTLNRKVVKTD